MLLHVRQLLLDIVLRCELTFTDSGCINIYNQFLDQELIPHRSHPLLLVGGTLFKKA